MNLTDEKKRSTFGLGFNVIASIFLLCQIAMIAIFALTMSKKDEIVQAKEAKKKIPVLAMEIAPCDFTDTIEIPGLLKSWATVKISSEISGRIVEILAEKGDKLSEGQIIMKIDSKAYKAERDKAAADLELARQNFDRKSKLFTAKSISEKDLEDAKNLLSSSQADLEIAEASLEKCEIRSPLSGYLDERPVELGEYVQPGTHVATIERIDKVKLLFSIPEKDIAGVRLDLPIPFRLDAIPIKTFTGKTIFVAKSAEMSSLSYRTELESSNEEQILRPGMIARVRVDKLPIKDVIMVPLVAVMPKYEGHYVYIAGKDGKARLREIKLGMVSGTKALVLEGLSAGEMLVVDGHRLLNENDDLIVRKTETLQ